MTKRFGLLVGLAAALVATGSASAGVRAGAAVVDASWHIGASQGQYAGTAIGFQAESGVDPYTHSTRKAASYALASRSTTRALVIEGSKGNRVAVVANDLYLPQDLLNRRVATLIEEHDRDIALGLREGEPTGITAESLAITASHSHSSPYYSTPSWGVWAFQDVMDIRFFEYMASRMAEAVIRASAAMVPARIGGVTVPFNEISSHSYGPQVGRDGTPAGQPWSFTTGEVSVVAVDEVSSGQPVATWIIRGLHPEWVFGDGVLNGDITQATYRILDREVGGVTIWSQRETGTAGPHLRARVHDPAEKRREFQDQKFGQLERAARLLADTVAAARADVVAGNVDLSRSETGDYAPMSAELEVASVSIRFAPPTTRPYPGVSNCNTDRAFEANPGVPIVGLPDCTFLFGAVTEPLVANSPIPPEALYDDLRESGVPVPTSYSTPAVTGLEETIAVHLMAMRIGDIGLTFAPAEQFTDQALNIRSRLDRTPENVWTGWDWTDPDPRWPVVFQPVCSESEGTWTCSIPRRFNDDPLVTTFSQEAYERMKAQIHNDAAGWEDPAYAPFAEAEPVDPADIKGNFTHEEKTGHGYGLVLAIGMANDYWGYVPTYREYRWGDHYRKALSGLGPHGADFLATRLVNLAAELNGGEPVTLSPLDLAYQAESARAQAMADHIGALAAAHTAVYEATLPPDGGSPEITIQPGDTRRFDAAVIEFTGGSSYADMPDVRVERRVSEAWEPWADTNGGVQIMVDFPDVGELPIWRAGNFEWRWTAQWEAFVSELPQVGGRPGVTPTGTYRFVVDGTRMDGIPPARVAYHLESEPFEVAPWGGITAGDIRVEPTRITFRIGPTNTYTYGTENEYVVGPVDYPDSYTSPIPFIDPARHLERYRTDDTSQHQQYCRRCSFNPWADTADVESATVRLRDADDGETDVAASDPDGDGVWEVAIDDSIVEATIPVAGIIDEYGEINGEPIGLLTN